MKEAKTDPRIVRTKKLIMDAFVHLLPRKNFSEITIQDITSAATINRATFYYHFTDKYDLLRQAIKQELMLTVFQPLLAHTELNRATITVIFLNITKFQVALIARCRDSFEAINATVESILHQEMAPVLHKLLLSKHADEDEQTLHIAASLLSWSIIGASVDWHQNHSISAEDYIQKAMPYLSGIERLT